MCFSELCDAAIYVLVCNIIYCVSMPAANTISFWDDDDNKVET